MIPALFSTQAFPQKESVPDRTRPRPANFERPVLIEFKGEINERLAGFFNRSMDKADATNADLIIVEVDSPGGLKIESLQMARRLRDSEAYTVVIIENEAISGGSLVSLGVDEIQINPDGKFGDSGEIGFDTERWAWRLIEPKVESYLSRDARDLAESKGRSPDLAESMVDSDHLVYLKTLESGEQEFMGVASDDVLKPDPPWEMVPEAKKDRFLTVSGKRAVELGLAQGHSSTRQEIAEELDFDLNTMAVYKPTMIDYTVDFLNNPFVTGLLILTGLVALYFELSAPGIGIGGLISFLCALLFFWSHFLGGTAGWLEVTLFVAGLGFIAAEIFLIPGLGIPGIMGVLLLFASVVLAGQEFVIPNTAEDWNRLFTSVLVTLLSCVAFIVAAVIITKNMGRIPLFRGIILDPDDFGNESDELATESKAQETFDGIAVGDWGIADSLLRPAGRVKVNGRVFDVISDGTFVEPGASVRVVKINGNVITVSEEDSV
jgi:membrane-bound serine protease (ClpP class)